MPYNNYSGYGRGPASRRSPMLDENNYGGTAGPNGYRRGPSPYRSSAPSGMRGTIQQLRNMDTSGIMGDLNAQASAVAQGIFGPGGSAEQATTQALRDTTATGFGPTSGGYQNAKMNILKQAHENMGRYMAENTLAARAQYQSELGDIFTGEASLEQLGLARKQLAQNQEMIDLQKQQAECGWGDRLGAGFSGALSGGIGGAGTGTYLAAANPMTIGLAAGVGFLGGLLGGC